MNQLSIVILAAGQGKRMYSSLPKVLQPIGGMSMLSRVLNTARSLAPQQIIVVYGHGGEQVRSSFSDKDIVWVEQSQQLGTGHALKLAAKHLPRQGKTLVLYGDVPLIDQQTLLDLIASAGDEFALLTDELTNPTGYGRIVRDAQNNISAIVEEKDCSDNTRKINEVNTGILLLPNINLPNYLAAISNNNAQAEYYLTDVIAIAHHEQIPVHGVKVKHHWQAAGVNNKLQLASLERVLQRNQAEALLNAGVRLADPTRLDIRGSLRHGRDVFIDVNVVFEGEIILGDEVEIGANCVLKNVCIGNGTRIAAFSHLDGASIAENCQIGPFSRLRPGAQLAKEVHIGNFVEVKNSSVNNNSKINHLSYIGDTKIGINCNIGAGTITCNYDGANKHITEIGNEVFVGSGCMLVAPVKLENNSTIGAGSVITKNSAANTLTIARTKQTNIPNWQRPKKK